MRGIHILSSRRKDKSGQRKNEGARSAHILSSRGRDKLKHRKKMIEPETLPTIEQRGSWSKQKKSQTSRGTH
jgi:hypothetical protein